MAKKLLVVVVVAGVLALGATSVVMAQSDPHVGTWKLNREKSKITPPPTNPPAQSVMRTYEPFEGKGIKATFVTITADGKRLTSTYSAHFDGTDYPYSGDTNLTAISLKRVDAYTWSATNKGAGKAMNTGTNSVSKDGKTLTWSFKGTNAQGQAVTGVQVFERQ